MKNILAILIILFPVSGLASDYGKIPEMLASDYGKIPEMFFSILETGDHAEAVDYLYDTNKWISNDSDQVVNLKNQLASLNGLVGKYLFHELLLEEKVGSHYAHLIYLVGYERQPLRFQIKVYKANEQWRFQGVSFDAELTDDVGKLANNKIVK